MHSIPRNYVQTRRRRSETIVLSFCVAVMAVMALGSVFTWSRSSFAASQTDEAATPDVPAAADCTVRPRAFDDIADLANAPAPTLVPVSGGGAADAGIVAAVTATIRMAIACANANDPLRSLAMFTDRYLAERLDRKSVV